MPWKKSEPMEERIEFGLSALGGENFRALCREYGITARTGYKWRERLVCWGTEGLREESRRPHHSPGALGEREVCEMVRLKQRHTLCAGCERTTRRCAISSHLIWRLNRASFSSTVRRRARLWIQRTKPAAFRQLKLFGRSRNRRIWSITSIINLLYNSIPV
ncbi:MAG: helix-turn-helix domain-containing protein [Verrucomicrobia bacterium]|nr:MAG: helix-turn-helix domain-containing protein [Verrucomicrobiota bacterium]